MIMLGLDYAAKHSERQLREAQKLGIRFVVRYLAPEYLHQYKSILKPEADMLKSLGLGVVSVYQRRNTQLSDFDLEHARLDANWARENAQLAGQTDGVIYFAMDFDAQPKHLPALQDYVDEVTRLLQDTAYEVGVYGSYRVVEEIDCAHKWQTYAWSGGRVSRKARFLQCHNGVRFVGGNNDLNVTFDEPGCWVKPQDTSFPGMPMLQEGMRQWQVSVLQSLLAHEGYDTRGIDADFGPGTDAAVRAYQKDSGLDVDGIAGKMTWDALIKDAALAPVEELLVKDPSEDVRKLESRVAALEEGQGNLLDVMQKIRDALKSV